MKKKRFLDFNQFDATDLVALTLILACLILRAFGKDGLVDMTISAIIGFYFGGKFRK